MTKTIALGECDLAIAIDQFGGDWPWPKSVCPSQSNAKAGVAGGTFVVSTTDQKSSCLFDMVHTGDLSADWNLSNWVERVWGVRMSFLNCDNQEVA